MRDVHDELRVRLREAAEAHEPDRARILARTERGMAEDPRPQRPARPPSAGWARVVGATGAVAGLLTVGGYAVASAVKGDEPGQTVAVSPSPPSSPDATWQPPVQPGPPPSKPASRKPSSPPSRTPDAGNPAPDPLPETSDNEDGLVWSDGSVDPHSNDFWAQSNLILKTSGKLTALTVELRIALTDGVSSAGAWRSLPKQDFTLTVGEEDGFLVHRWVLKKDRTVPEGEFVFAGQYDHARGGRDAKDDRYAIRATADGEQFTVGGDFASDGGDEDTNEGDS